MKDLKCLHFPASVMRPHEALNVGEIFSMIQLNCSCVVCLYCCFFLTTLVLQSQAERNSAKGPESVYIIRTQAQVRQANRSFAFVANVCACFSGEPCWPWPKYKASSDERISAKRGVAQQNFRLGLWGGRAHGSAWEVL